MALDLSGDLRLKIYNDSDGGGNSGDGDRGGAGYPLVMNVVMTIH